MAGFVLRVSAGFSSGSPAAGLRSFAPLAMGRLGDPAPFLETVGNDPREGYIYVRDRVPGDGTNELLRPPFSIVETDEGDPLQFAILEDGTVFWRAAVGNEAYWTPVIDVGGSQRAMKWAPNKDGTHGVEATMGWDLRDMGELALPRSVLFPVFNSAGAFANTRETFIQIRAQSETVSFPDAVSSIDSVIQVPANSIVFACPVRCNTPPGGVATWGHGLVGNADLFSTGLTAAAAVKDAGWVRTPAEVAWDKQAALIKVRIFTNVVSTDALGEFKFEVYHLEMNVVGL